MRGKVRQGLCLCAGRGGCAALWQANRGVSMPGKGCAACVQVGAAWQVMGGKGRAGHAHPCCLPVTTNSCLRPVSKVD